MSQSRDIGELLFVWEQWLDREGDGERQNPNLEVGCGLQSCKVATPSVWPISYHEGSALRISLTTGLYLGPLLASYSESLSRTHDIASFWIIRTPIKQPQVRLVQSLTWPPTVSQPIECVWQVLDPCIKALQRILLVLEAILLYGEKKLFSFMERTIPSCLFFLTILLTCVEDVMRLDPARPTVMESFLTSRCRMTVTTHQPPELFVEVLATNHDVACGKMLFSSCLQLFVDLQSFYPNYLYVASTCALSLSFKALMFWELFSIFVIFCFG
ncbi:hypothetical protein AtNW77_Chr4g0281311 [Arabidopsis thaliana]|uniref:Uncharacterized protein n=2 Tax=Arabidopsis TaxID=3701 RepID=A0A8T2DTC9_9BRAS|nr:hypothetical protein ISN45_At04g008590 [Arabidopsis thaliana x Arabidopsis arenosa]